MSTNEFDQKIKAKLEQGAFEYKPERWQDMLQQLEHQEQSHKKKAFVLLPAWGVAASVIVLISVLGLGLYTLLPHHEHQLTATSSEITNNKILPEPTPSTQPVAPTEQDIKGQHTLTLAHHKLLQHQAPAIAQTTFIAAEHTAPEKTIKDIEHTNNLTEEHTTPKVAATQPKTPVNTTDMMLELPATAHPYSEPGSLSIGGGVNYGKLNTSGYTITTNVRKSISERLFVEGDVAFVNNSSPDNTYNLSNNNFNYIGSSTGTGGTGSHGISNIGAVQSAGTSVNNFYYLQLTPTLGYHVHKRIAVGLGADVQRLFQNSNTTTTVYEDGAFKLVPVYDVGMVAKTEYAITRSLKTSLTYRAGLNNLSENKYINRSYLQLQLKLKILGR